MLYDKIKSVAKSRGVSINKIESDLGFSSSSISKWKKSMPGANSLKMVADYLEVSIDELLDGESEVQEDASDASTGKS